MSYDRRFAALHDRLFFAMSADDARETLGFPVGYVPSTIEIQKAYRRKALENHPDRGGDARKMVEINVAKEILEGKRSLDRTPYTRPEKDPETVRREEFTRKKQAALQTVKTAKDQVSRAIELFTASADITRGKLHIRDFLSDDFAEALDTMQNEIEDSPNKHHHDWQTAEALCQSLSNKALRLGKKYLNHLQAHGDMATALLGFEGARAVTYHGLVRFHGMVVKFIATFNALHVDASKLMTLIHTSEEVPDGWDDVFHRAYQIVLAFKENFAQFDDRQLKACHDELETGAKNTMDALVSMGIDAPGPAWEHWRFPDDFDWAKGLIAEDFIP